MEYNIGSDQVTFYECGDNGSQVAIFNYEIKKFPRRVEFSISNIFTRANGKLEDLKSLLPEVSKEILYFNRAVKI